MPVADLAQGDKADRRGCGLATTVPALRWDSLGANSRVTYFPTYRPVHADGRLVDARLAFRAQPTDHSVVFLAKIKTLYEPGASRQSC